MIPEALLEEIQARIDIADVISQYVSLKRAGRNFKALCPFHHEKSPSFMVNRDKQIYHCFGCGEGGDAFAFLMKYEKLSFREAVKALADRAGVSLPLDSKSDAQDISEFDLIYKANATARDFYISLLKSDKGAGAREYLKKRGLDGAIAGEFGLGYAPAEWDGLIKYAKSKGIDEKRLEKAGLIISSEGRFHDRFRNRVMFPILDMRSRVVAFGGRVLDDSLPKYINSPETVVYKKGKSLYGLNMTWEAMRDKEEAVIVEGYVDLLTPYASGFKNIVASLGTALTEDQVRLLKRYTNCVYMVYDADAAGEAAMLRGLDIFLAEDVRVKIVELESGLDPDTFIKKRGADAFKKRLEVAKDLFDYKLGILLKRYDVKSIEERSQIAMHMLSTIARVKNSILKSSYIKNLSERLGVNEASLLKELKSQKTQSPSFREEKAPIQAHPANAAQFDSAEKMLIGIMLDNEKAIDIVQKKLKPFGFSNPILNEIYAKAVKLKEEGKKINSNRLIRLLDTPEAKRSASEILNSLPASGDMDKCINDCVMRIKEKRVKERLDFLRTKLDEDPVLLKEYNELYKLSTSRTGAGDGKG